MFSGFLNLIFSGLEFLTNKHLFLIVTKKATKQIPNISKRIKVIFYDFDALIFLIIN